MDEDLMSRRERAETDYKSRTFKSPSYEWKLDAYADKIIDILRVIAFCSIMMFFMAVAVLTWLCVR